jgi:hypothetical protein
VYSDQVRENLADPPFAWPRLLSSAASPELCAERYSTGRNKQGQRRGQGHRHTMRMLQAEVKQVCLALFGLRAVGNKPMIDIAAGMWCLTSRVTEPRDAHKVDARPREIEEDPRVVAGKGTVIGQRVVIYSEQHS